MKRGCTQCGECLNVCPVFQVMQREEFSPKAKRLLMEPVAAGTPSEDLDWKEVAELARLCAGCGKCQQACARKLSTADLLADVRSQNPHWTQALWEVWIRHMGPAWPAFGRIASWVPDALTPKALETSLATAKAILRKGATAPWVALRPAADAAIDAARPVMVFAGCTARYTRPEWVEKAETLLKKWGYTVADASGMSCCGGTLHHAGQYDAVNKLQQQNLAWWRKQGSPRIVAFCASCYHGLQAYVDALPEEDSKQWKNSLTSLSSLLVSPCGDVTSAKPEIYGYHQPCHWGTADPDKVFLQKVLPGMKTATNVCCGMGGILKMSNPDLSATIAEHCLAVFPPEVENIITGCSGCTMQLAAYASENRRIYHWLDVVTV